tara:strand:- start:407 stop:733 length:327 start_codon:yes stop_codon:yes gene_type:complete
MPTVNVPFACPPTHFAPALQWRAIAAARVVASAEDCEGSLTLLARTEGRRVRFLVLRRTDANVVTVSEFESTVPNTSAQRTAFVAAWRHVARLSFHGSPRHWKRLAQR